MDTILVQAILAGTGFVISLVFQFVPAIKAWYDKLGDKKGLFMVGVSAVVALAIFGLSCAGLSDEIGLPSVACDIHGGAAVFMAFLSTLTGNQLAYLTTKNIGKES